MLEKTDLQEREPYRQLAASIPVPLLVIGPDDEVVFANPACEQFFGTAAAMLCGGKLNELMFTATARSPIPVVGGRRAPETAIASGLPNLIAQARRSGAAIESCDVVIETRRGEQHIADVSAAPYGGITGAVVAILHEREFAGRMSWQQGLRDRLRSFNGMADVLAHEIKNPLSGIRGAAQLLEETLGDGEQSLARLICAESDRIRTLLDNMGVLGDARRDEFLPVNIHEVLDRARAIARVGFSRNASFRDAFDPSLPPVVGNRDQLIQVFVNLIRNASDALPKSGGEILLATAFRPGLFVGTDGDRRAVPLEVTVRDNGCGVAPDVMPHIFDPFVTTKPRGAGLGLALVAKIVSEHGGLVEYHSVPGRTDFRVLLPVVN